MFSPILKKKLPPSLFPNKLTKTLEINKAPFITENTDCQILEFLPPWNSSLFLFSVLWVSHSIEHYHLFLVFKPQTGYLHLKIFPHLQQIYLLKTQRTSYYCLSQYRWYNSSRTGFKLFNINSRQSIFCHIFNFYGLEISSSSVKTQIKCFFVNL